MNAADLGNYKDLYLQTAKDYADKISTSLEKLTANLLDKEALSTLHIGSHSLKSQSQVMGFTDIANICLGIEKMSDDALKGNSQLTHKNILDIKQSIIEIEHKLKQIEV